MKAGSIRYEYLKMERETQEKIRTWVNREWSLEEGVYNLPGERWEAQQVWIEFSA